MTTARNIIKKRMKKHGNTLLGVGVYSAVIDQGSKQNKVIKIGNTLTDPWIDYYQYLKIDLHPHLNLFVPLVLFFVFQPDQHFYPFQHQVGD